MEKNDPKKPLSLKNDLKQIRNCLFVLSVSLGVPVLNMGVECGQSSGGSSSCGYRKPFDWYALSKGFGIQTTQFISFFSSLRMRGDLKKRSFMKEESINRHGNDQNPPR